MKTDKQSGKPPTEALDKDASNHHYSSSHISVTHSLYLAKDHIVKLPFVCGPHNMDFIKNHRTLGTLELFL
jgi:hypothetical protein